MSLQAKLQTRAERTGYTETSHYDDVIGFLEALKLPIIWVATSNQGRKVPLVTLGKGKLKVYIQANIHGGEVEGKEAALMLLRDLPVTQPKLLEKLTLLVCPIYNCDGNEKWGEGKRNRGSQDGPEVVGERPNGAGLDLNRDCMKVESPEMRGVLEHVYRKHDPALVLDLHTTNGTRHGFHLTYSPPLNPNTDPGVLAYVRDSLLPTVRKRLDTEKAWKLFDYGNTEQRGGERIWATFGEEPRYVTNYAGLRGRLSVLSEAASFLPFETRVKVTYDFVLAVLEEAAKDSAKILKFVKEADKRRRSELGVRFEMASRGSEIVPLEKPLPASEIDHRKGPKELESIELPIWDRFKSTKSLPVPKGYVLNAPDDVIGVLRHHGIRIEKLQGTFPSAAQKFVIRQRTVGKTPFQGHRLIQLEGEWGQPAKGDFTGYWITTDQPLQALIVTLLEPESLDSVVAWGLIESEPMPAIFRIPR